MSNKNKLKYWLTATRPKTLPAGLIPVVIASSAAYYKGFFDWFLFLITVVCSILIQIITNYLNELFDYKKGADTEERIGPQRQVASGNITPKAMAWVSAILMLITFCLGLILVWKGGIVILIIGLVSLFFAFAYTGGPYPLAYKGLGDIFVLLFFGFAAVCGTYYIQTGQSDTLMLICSLPPGFLSMNILGVNNIRDIETDKKVNKLTLAVRLGATKAKVLFLILNALTYVACIFISIEVGSYYLLLPLISMPLAIVQTKNIFLFQPGQLNKILEGTGKLLMIYGVLISIGFILAKYY